MFNVVFIWLSLIILMLLQTVNGIENNMEICYEGNKMLLAGEAIKREGNFHYHGQHWTHIKPNWWELANPEVLIWLYGEDYDVYSFVHIIW